MSGTHPQTISMSWMLNVGGFSQFHTTAVFRYYALPSNAHSQASRAPRPVACRLAIVLSCGLLCLLAAPALAASEMPRSAAATFGSAWFDNSGQGIAAPTFGGKRASGWIAVADRPEGGPGCDYDEVSSSASEDQSAAWYEYDRRSEPGLSRWPADVSRTAWEILPRSLIAEFVAAKGPFWTPAKNKTPVENAYRHFKDHGAEFGAKNSADYVKSAQDFLRNPPGGTLTKVRPNGDVVRYHPGTNTFGVMDSAGAPRTMFKPDPSVHGKASNLDYFNAQ